MKPFVADPDFTLYVGNVIDVLAELAARRLSQLSLFAQDVA